MLCEECREVEGVITCPDCGVLMCEDCFGDLDNSCCIQCTLDTVLEIEDLDRIGTLQFDDDYFEDFYL
jgi:hypothetical protein